MTSKDAIPCSTSPRIHVAPPHLQCYPLNPCIPEFCICARHWVTPGLIQTFLLYIQSKSIIIFFLIGSTNGPILFYIIQDSLKTLLATVFKLGGKKKIVNLIFPKAKISLRSSWKEGGKKTKKNLALRLGKTVFPILWACSSCWDIFLTEGLTQTFK